VEVTNEQQAGFVAVSGRNKFSRLVSLWQFGFSRIYAYCWPADGQLVHVA
jgi:hypothetical protein